MSKRVQKSGEIIKEELRAASDLLESDRNRNTAEYVIGVEVPASETLITDANINAYEYYEVPLSSEARDELREEAASQVDDFYQELEDSQREIENYDIDNVEKEILPLQYIKENRLNYPERYEPLVESESFQNGRYEEAVDDIGFQALRFNGESEGDTLIAFQQFTRRQISSNSDSIRLTMSNERYSQFDDTVVTIPESFDCVWYKDKIYVFHPKKSENIFDFLEQYKGHAADVVEGLQDSGLKIHNIDEFGGAIGKDRRALRKMKSVKERSLYDSLSRDEVEDVVDEFSLDLKIENDEDGDWGITVPSMRKKWDVIRLLNDDHVVSYLDQSRQYQALGKDPVD